MHCAAGGRRGVLGDIPNMHRHLRQAQMDFGGMREGSDRDTLCRSHRKDVLETAWSLAYVSP